MDRSKRKNNKIKRSSKPRRKSFLCACKKIQEQSKYTRNSSSLNKYKKKTVPSTSPIKKSPVSVTSDSSSSNIRRSSRRIFSTRNTDNSVRTLQVEEFVDVNYTTPPNQIRHPTGETTSPPTFYRNPVHRRSFNLREEESVFNFVQPDST